MWTYLKFTLPFLETISLKTSRNQVKVPIIRSNCLCLTEKLFYWYYISRDRCPCVCVCVSLVFTYRVRSCALWTVPDNASFPGPWTMPLTTATTYNNHDDDTDTDCITTLNNNGTVVEREWTSPGYGNEGAPRCTAEPPCSEPLLPTGEQLQCKGISGQQLESPRGRLEISFESRGEKLPCQCPEHEISNRLKAMVEHKRVRL